jgi:hypothetical protein
VHQIIETEDGDEGTSWKLIDVNHEALIEHLEMGVKGVEQVFMLDILAQLYMSLCDFQNYEYLLTHGDCVHIS